MGIYIILATFLFHGFLLKPPYQKIHYKLSLIILFAFTAFRNIDLGGFDTVNYQNFFYFEVPSISHFFNYTGRFGYGYTLFNSVIRSISGDYRLYQVAYSFLAIILLNIVIKKLELKYNERSLFLFVYFCYRFLWNNFVLLRQNIAALTFWIAILTVLDKPLKYNARIAITWLWHETSIVNALIYPVLQFFRRFSRKKMLIVTMVLSVFAFLFSQTILNNLFGIFFALTGARFQRYATLLISDEGINLVNYLLRWLFLALFYLKYDKIDNPNKSILLAIGSFAVILGSINVGFVGRMVEYYMIAIYGIMALGHQAFPQKSKPLYLLGIYGIFILTLIRFLHTFSNGELINYSTFFFM